MLGKRYWYFITITGIWLTVDSCATLMYKSTYELAVNTEFKCLGVLSNS